jgi:cytochrome c-type biogenesis protein CcmF
MVLMAIGIIGIEMFQTQTQGTIAQGESITLGRYSITFDGLYIFNTDDGRNVALAEVSVYRDGVLLDKLQPRRDYYIESQQPMTIPGVRSSMEDDFYVLLVDWQPVSTGGATFKIYHNPLVNWMWLGGFLIILGTVVAIWPDKESEMEASPIHQAVTPVKA